MIIKKSYIKILFRFLPLLLLIGVVVYLGSINSTAEVYIELETEQIRFNVIPQGLREYPTELISGTMLDSLQLFDCSLEIGPNAIRDSHGDVLEGGAGFIRTQKIDTVFRSQIILKEIDYLRINEIAVPGNSEVTLAVDHNIITMSINLGDRLPSSDQSYLGEVGVGQEFLLSGRNFKINGADAYSAYELFAVTTDEWDPNVSFYADAEDIGLQLFLRPDQSEEIDLLVEKIRAKAIRFATTLETRPWDRVRSSIRSGKIQIAGVDFFRKRYLIKEEALDESDFLRIPPGEEYFIDFIRVDQGGLRISLWNEFAHGLEKGKHSRLTRSIFPSILDLLIAEPAKNTVWMIFIFALTQGTLLWRTLRKTGK